MNPRNPAPTEVVIDSLQATPVRGQGSVARGSRMTICTSSISTRRSGRCRASLSRAQRREGGTRSPRWARCSSCLAVARRGSCTTTSGRSMSTARVWRGWSSWRRARSLSGATGRARRRRSRSPSSRPISRASTRRPRRVRGRATQSSSSTKMSRRARRTRTRCAAVDGSRMPSPATHPHGSVVACLRGCSAGSRAVQVRSWLAHLGLAQHAYTFEAHEIDFEVLLTLQAKRYGGLHEPAPLASPAASPTPGSRRSPR